MQRMGNIDNAVPFFGKGFNKIYPLIMVVYTLLVASGFFHRIVNVSGFWKRVISQNEADELDGVDPSGLLILKKGKLGSCKFLQFLLCKAYFNIIEIQFGFLV